VKLRHLDEETAHRRRCAALYDEHLCHSGLALPQVRADAAHVWHQYVVRTTRREQLRAALQREDIGSLVHYPVPVHAQPAYRGRLALDPAGLAHSEAAAREVLSLPLHGHLELRAVERVTAVIEAWRTENLR
jgi:dTDP-4-amino-4,6-dideoxygalactose transaminase